MALDVPQGKGGRSRTEDPEVQKRFHPLDRPSGAYSHKLKLGWMVEDKSTTAAKGDGHTTDYRPRMLRFMFNPAEVGVDYAINGQQLSQEAQNATAAASVNPIYPNPITANYSLFFNRTVDVAAGTAPKGVMHDIAHFERMIGFKVYSGRAGTFDFARISTLSINPLKIFFGGHKESLKFRGYVMGASVAYTQFSVHMVPTICQLSITVQQLLTGDPTWEGSGGGGSGTGGGKKPAKKRPMPSTGGGGHRNPL